MRFSRPRQSPPVWIFPARTVVITVADRRTNRGWESLTASELQQMTGRAGRRGKDKVGFVIAAPGPHQNPQRIGELLAAPPTISKANSRDLHVAAELLDAFGSFAQVRDIAERSFAFRNLLAAHSSSGKATRSTRQPNSRRA
jgi:replicative superfamily II helicase